MTKFSLANVTTAQGDRAALEVGGRYYLLQTLAPEIPASGLRPLLDDWDGLFKRCAALADGLADNKAAAALVSSPQLLAPVRYPNKLVCVGAVYSDHLIQFGLPPERWPSMPMFLRPPTVSIIGPGATVRIPPTTKQFDWEIELAVIVGKRLTAASEDEAGQAIAGYSVGIDFSCRDLLDRGSAVGVDLIRSKAQDGMAPLGPVVTPAAFIRDVQDLTLRLWVNGVQKQNGTTANMLFSVREQLSVISRYITLEPGDVVFTGSPAGSADGDEDFLKIGDHIRAEIEDVGVLELSIPDPAHA